MNTRYELVLHGPNPVALRAAGEEALEEIGRLEDVLSIYRPHTEIALVNARAAREAVRVTPLVFRLLQHAQRLWRETEGAFDITIGPLMRCWGFLGGTGALPDPVALAEARACTGFQHVILDEGGFNVRFDREGVMLDLGAIGKGFAIERAMECLREAGVECALLHGGTSTVAAMGIPPDEEAWKIVLEIPAESPEAPPVPLAVVRLRDEALSVSAVWGKSFQTKERTFGHVLDPRTGEPADRAVMSAVVCASATESDALSTALLTLGLGGVKAIAGLRPLARAMAVNRSAEGVRFAAEGFEVRLKEGRGRMEKGE